MVRRTSKNKVRCDYCGKYLNGHGCIHTNCVDPYVKQVLNRSIIVTIFDKVKKPMVMLLFVLLSISFVSAYFIWQYSSNNSVSGFYVHDQAYNLDDGTTGVFNLTIQTYNNSWLEFDGVNDMINLSNPIGDLDNFSVSFWSKTSDGSGNEVFFGLRDSVINSLRFYVEGGQIKVSYYNVTGNEQSKFYGLSISPNVWYYNTFTYNRNEQNGTLYQNGDFDVSLIGNGQIANSSQMSFGSAHIYNYLVGGIDEVRLYNRVLSSSEISEIYSSGRIANNSLPSDGLVLWYSFDEQNGSIVYDKSGNGNNGE